MDNILRAVDSSVVFLVIFILIAVLLFFSIIKQFLKLMFLLLLLAALYAGYLYVSGGKIPKDSEALIEQGRQQVETIKQSGGKLLQLFDEESKSQDNN